MFDVSWLFLMPLSLGLNTRKYESPEKKRMKKSNVRNKEPPLRSLCPLWYLRGKRKENGGEKKGEEEKKYIPNGEIKITTTQKAKEKEKIPEKYEIKIKVQSGGC
jgi:hypothetical protein